MPGSLAIPNTFLNHSGEGISRLDTDFTTVRDYVNNREITQGLLANRPAPGTAGAWYLATDVNGGTLYSDSGAAWVQAAAGVLVSGGALSVSLASAGAAGF